jgi:hypothetical protein
MWKQPVISFCKERAIRPSTTNDAQLKLSARPATEQPPHLRTHRNNNSTQNQKTRRKRNNNPSKPFRNDPNGYQKNRQNHAPAQPR